MSNLRETVKDPALLQNAVRSDDPNLNFASYPKEDKYEKSLSTNQSIPQIDYKIDNRPYIDPIEKKERIYA